MLPSPDAVPGTGRQQPSRRAALLHAPGFSFTKLPLPLAACAACFCAWLRGILPYAVFKTTSGTGPEEGEVLSEIVCWAVVTLFWRWGWLRANGGYRSLSHGGNRAGSSQRRVEEDGFECVVGDDDLRRNDEEEGADRTGLLASFVGQRGRGKLEGKWRKGRWITGRALLRRFFYWISRVSQQTEWQGAGGEKVWILALCLATASAYQAEVGPVWLLPALTPLVFGTVPLLQPNIPLPFTKKPVLSLMATLAFRAILCFSTSLDRSIQDLALSVIPAAALFVVYVSAVPRSASVAKWLPRLPDLEDIGPLSMRTILLLMGVLAWQTITYGTPVLNWGWPVVTVGLVKALCWFFTILTARNAFWWLAPDIAIFGFLASRDPAIYRKEYWNAPILAAAAFAQIIIHLPGSKAKWLCLVLGVLPFSSWIAEGVAISRVGSYQLYSIDHPVAQLVRQARDDFQSMLERQSKTYSEAVAEYRRRYGLDPPPGFEAWYGYAEEIKSPLIDEFDGIFRSIRPFLHLSGRQVLDMMARVQRLPDADVWTCTISSITANTVCKHPTRIFDRNISYMFNRLLGNLRDGVLPRDVTFLVNHLDEPAVMLPRSKNPAKPITIANFSGRATWDAITEFCGVIPQRGHGKDKDAHHIDTYGLPFVTNVTRSRNICANPSYSHQHGLFISPASFRLIEGRVPVLSTGAPSTMADILFPSPAHVVEPEFRYDPSVPVVPWEKKDRSAYWAGADTGGMVYGTSHHDADKWRQFHRQRFISLAQNLQRSNHTYLREVKTTTTDPSTGEQTTQPRVVPVSSTYLNTHLYRVHPTHLHTCLFPYFSASRAARIACRAERAFFRLVSRQPASTSYAHRLVFDLDGNGISGRFPRLLASGSLVLKQVGALREWWNDDSGEGGDGRVRAWVHYIPVSMDMGEVPELVHFLLETGQGNELAREVAEQGREWMAKAMREEDVKLFLWRLVLELARVEDPERGPILV
ncbi:hypothetical protein VTJ04DRAFT_9341 [Mycothermus thermophilus]|uniref:uncharacterized protein n=1 Tax=Humicola insolens TaxID=85995 RepID=UPI0037434DD3